MLGLGLAEQAAGHGREHREALGGDGKATGDAIPVLSASDPVEGGGDLLGSGHELVASGMLRLPLDNLSGSVILLGTLPAGAFEGPETLGNRDEFLAQDLACERLASHGVYR